MSQNQVSAAYSQEKLLSDKWLKIIAEMVIMISELTPAQKLSCVQENSVTLQRWLLGREILLKLSRTRSDLRQYLELSNQLLPISDTSQSDGKKIVKMNDC